MCNWMATPARELVRVHEVPSCKLRLCSPIPFGFSPCECVKRNPYSLPPSSSFELKWVKMPDLRPARDFSPSMLFNGTLKNQFSPWSRVAMFCDVITCKPYAVEEVDFIANVFLHVVKIYNPDLGRGIIGDSRPGAFGSRAKCAWSGITDNAPPEVWIVVHTCNKNSHSSYPDPVFWLLIGPRHRNRHVTCVNRSWLIFPAWGRSYF